MPASKCLPKWILSARLLPRDGWNHCMDLKRPQLWHLVVPKVSLVFIFISWPSSSVSVIYINIAVVNFRTEKWTKKSLVFQRLCQGLRPSLKIISRCRRITWINNPNIAFRFLKKRQNDSKRLEPVNRFVQWKVLVYILHSHPELLDNLEEHFVVYIVLPLESWPAISIDFLKFFLSHKLKVEPSAARRKDYCVFIGLVYSRSNSIGLNIWKWQQKSVR
jgi:hypothetical protein